MSLIATSLEKDPLEIWVIVRSEKVLSSNPILSVPFEKSVIISATFISVLASAYLGCHHTVLIPVLSQTSIEQRLEIFQPDIILNCSNRIFKSHNNILMTTLKIENKNIYLNGSLIKPKKEYFKIKNIKNLEDITNIFFSRRRKMIKKPLNLLFKNVNEISKKLKINLNDRPQNLSPMQYFQICAEYEKLIF